ADRAPDPLSAAASEARAAPRTAAAAVGSGARGALRRAGGAAGGARALRGALRPRVGRRAALPGHALRLRRPGDDDLRSAVRAPPRDAEDRRPLGRGEVPGERGPGEVREDDADGAGVPRGAR